MCVEQNIFERYRACQKVNVAFTAAGCAFYLSNFCLFFWLVGCRL